MPISKILAYLPKAKIISTKLIPTNRLIDIALDKRTANNKTKNFSLSERFKR